MRGSGDTCEGTFGKWKPTENVSCFYQIIHLLRCLSDDSQWPVGKESTHWKRSWCSERLRAAGEGGDKWWDGWTASLTQWAWVWANSGRWWRTGKLGVLQSMGSKRVRHDWATERQQWLVKGFSAGHPWSHLYRCKNFSAALSWVNHPLPDLADTQQADPHRHPETRMSSSLLIEYSDVS